MKNKGITLIALTITIIILLILATVSIIQLTKNGIIGKSKNAIERHQEEEEKEAIKLTLASWKNEKYSNPQKTFSEFFRAEFPIESEIKEFNGDSKTIIVTIKRNGNHYKVSEEEEKNITEGGKLVSFIFNEESTKGTIELKVEGQEQKIKISKSTDFWFDLNTKIKVTCEGISKEITNQEGVKEQISVKSYLDEEEINQDGISITVTKIETYTVRFMTEVTCIYLLDGTVIKDERKTLSRI